MGNGWIQKGLRMLGTDVRKEWFVAMSQATVMKLIDAPESATKLWLALADMGKWFDEPGSWIAGESWPSWRYLRQKYRLSFKAIAAGIPELVRRQLLHVRVPRTGSTHYFLSGFVLFRQGAAARVDVGRDGSPQESSDRSLLSPGEQQRSPQESSTALPRRAKQPRSKQPRKNGGAPARVAAEDGVDGGLLEIVRRRGMRGADWQKTDLARALVARLGSREVAAAFLELPGQAGRDVIEIDTAEIDEFKKRGGPTRPRCPTENCNRGWIPGRYLHSRGERCARAGLAWTPGSTCCRGDLEYVRCPSCGLKASVKGEENFMTGQLNTGAPGWPL